VCWRRRSPRQAKGSVQITAGDVEVRYSVMDGGSVIKERLGPVSSELPLQLCADTRVRVLTCVGVGHVDGRCRPSRIRSDRTRRPEDLGPRPAAWFAYRLDWLRVCLACEGRTMPQNGNGNNCEHQQSRLHTRYSDRAPDQWNFVRHVAFDSVPNVWRERSDRRVCLQISWRRQPTW
jgi:hypothetical protein